jgi:hypothetical protein
MFLPREIWHSIFIIVVEDHNYSTSVPLNSLIRVCKDWEVIDFKLFHKVYLTHYRTLGLGDCAPCRLL